MSHAPDRSATRAPRRRRDDGNAGRRHRGQHQRDQRPGSRRAARARRSLVLPGEQGEEERREHRVEPVRRRIAERAAAEHAGRGAGRPGRPAGQARRRASARGSPVRRPTRSPTTRRGELGLGQPPGAAAQGGRNGDADTRSRAIRSAYVEITGASTAAGTSRSMPTRPAANAPPSADATRVSATVNDHSAVEAAPKESSARTSAPLRSSRAFTGQIVTYPDAEREGWRWRPLRPTRRGRRGRRATPA